MDSTSQRKPALPRRSASSSIVMPRSAPSVAWATCHPEFSAPTRLAAGILTSLRKTLAEVRVADGVADGPHLDAGRGHVQQEVRNAFAFRGIRVGAGQQQAPIRMHAAAGPQLLTVDDDTRPRLCARWSAGSPDPIRPRVRRTPEPRSRRRGSREGVGGAVRRFRRRAMSMRRDECRRTRGRAGVRRGRPTPDTTRSVRRPACRRPHFARGQCGTAKPALCNSANQAFWKRTNSSSLTPVCASRQPCGMCSSHQDRTVARNSARSAGISDFTRTTR